MRKKQYTRPVCEITPMYAEMLCVSGGNTYDPSSESGLIRTSTTAVDASQAEVKRQSSIDWDGWE